MPRVDAERYAPGSNAWTTAGRTRWARTSHTATLLPDGRVLVVGGGKGVEHYDPEASRWVFTDGPRRRSHTATLLDDGRLLLVGGRAKGQLPAELMDPMSAEAKPTFPPRERRSAHTATRLADGSVLVTGGWSSAQRSRASSTVERFDPKSGLWAEAAPMVHARAEHTATLLPDGRVVVIGGRPEPGRSPKFAVPEVELYDPVADRWTDVGALAHGAGERFAATAIALADGRVLLAAGNKPDPKLRFPPALTHSALLRVR